MKKKTRRGQRIRNKMINFNVMYNNLRGIKSKVHSLQSILNEKQPAIIALAETKLNEGETIELDGYHIERVDRTSDSGGGVLIAYMECIKNIMTVAKEEKTNCEILWMTLDNGKVKVKIAVVYMPQENDIKKEELQKIYKEMEKDVIEAQSKGESILVMGDFNCKIGDKIEGNNDEVTKGGIMLLEMCKNTGMGIVNSLKNCEGTWTRVQGKEKSIIDYVLVWEDDIPYINHMKIDVNHEHTPYSTDGNVHTYSDHYMIEISCNWQMKCKVEASSNQYMGKEEYERFEKELECDEVSKMIKENDFENSYQAWSNKVLEIAKKNSRKRKVKSPWKSNRLLSRAKKNIQEELKRMKSPKQRKVLMARKRLIMSHIINENKAKYYSKVNRTVENIKMEGGVNSTAFYELRRRLSRKKKENGHSVIGEDGIRYDSPEEIKNEHVKYYKKLLTETHNIEGTPAVSRVISGMKVLAQCTESERIDEDEVTKIIKKLKKRKASDKQGWRNEYAIYGGVEMTRSLTKIAQIASDQLECPKEWDDMTIKSVHKKGSKMLLTNKRGLFITNIIGKILERVLKERNKISFADGLDPSQTGGQPGRHMIDNVFTILSIIERNTYLNKTTYLTFADVRKCFDRLWLDDGIKDLWMCGVNVRDAMMVRRMNENAKITVDSPVGLTDEFKVNNIVKQGTVYAVDICAAGMAHINNTGYGIRTMYGPDLDIGALEYVDDMVSAGTANTSNNTVQACAMLEEKKKVSINTDAGKSAVMKINKKKYNDSITKQVNKGEFKEVIEYKLTGVWIDEKAKYMKNIIENRKRIGYLNNNTKAFANEYNMGNLATLARIQMLEIAIIPAVLHGSEAFPSFTTEEEKELEKLQGTILRGIMEVPPSTPYYPLLYELGLPTMISRVHYRKLMLYHSITNSGERRIARNVLNAQRDMDREGTWLGGVKKIMAEYGIDDTTNDDLKSRWKKKVKEKLRNKVEERIRTECIGKSKSRTVLSGEYEMKEYLKETTVTEAKLILKTRLHMSKIPCNYKRMDLENCCWLCGSEEARSEHYYECKGTRIQQKIWKARVEDLITTDRNTLLRTSKFMEKVADMYKPKWEAVYSKGKINGDVTLQL